MYDPTSEGRCAVSSASDLDTQVNTVGTVKYAFNAAKPKSILTARKNPGVRIAGLLDTMRPQKIAQNLLKKNSS